MSLELQLAPRRELKQFVQIAERAFIWRCTSDAWLNLVDLLEPFVNDRRGHQYLTSEVDDDALVEVSLHETHAGLGIKE
ncbi:MAG: hypothetical protein KGK07_05570 [Chloroflexota bacterium]|nr:hypothetical protein [Chloroflexota bacterium]